jgi:hypothetical protein
VKVRLSWIDDAQHVLRTRVPKNAASSNGREVDLGIIDRDKTDIALIRYMAPTLLVRAVAEDGKTIKGFQAKLKYLPGRAPTEGEYLRDGKPAGDVSFARQDDGRWRASQLLPDEGFTVTVDAPGYEPKSEKLKLSEGAVKELEVRLKKKS